MANQQDDSMSCDMDPDTSTYRVIEDDPPSSGQPTVSDHDWPWHTPSASSSRHPSSGQYPSGPATLSRQASASSNTSPATRIFSTGHPATTPGLSASRHSSASGHLALALGTNQPPASTPAPRYSSLGPYRDLPQISSRSTSGQSRTVSGTSSLRTISGPDSRLGMQHTPMDDAAFDTLAVAIGQVPITVSAPRDTSPGWEAPGPALRTERVEPRVLEKWGVDRGEDVQGNDEAAQQSDVQWGGGDWDVSPADVDDAWPEGDYDYNPAADAGNAPSEGDSAQPSNADWFTPTSDLASEVDKQQLDDAARPVAELVDELVEVKEEKKRLEKQVRTQVGEIDRLDREVARLEEDKDSREAAAVDEAITAVVEMGGSSSDQALAEENARLRENNVSLIQEVNRYRPLVAELEKMQMVRAVNQTLVVENDRLVELLSMSEAWAMAEGPKGLKEKNYDLMNEVARLKKELDDGRKEGSHGTAGSTDTSKLAALRDTVDGLEDEAEALKAKNAYLEAEKKRLDERNKKLGERNKVLTETKVKEVAANMDWNMAIQRASKFKFMEDSEVKERVSEGFLPARDGDDRAVRASSPNTAPDNETTPSSDLQGQEEEVDDATSDRPVKRKEKVFIDDKFKLNIRKHLEGNNTPKSAGNMDQGKQIDWCTSSNEAPKQQEDIKPGNQSTMSHQAQAGEFGDGGQDGADFKPATHGDMYSNSPIVGQPGFFW